MTCPIRTSDDGPETRDEDTGCTHCGDTCTLVEMGDEALCAVCHREALVGEAFDTVAPFVHPPAQILHPYAALAA